jgi:hypothetical protein
MNLDINKVRPSAVVLLIGYLAIAAGPAIPAGPAAIAGQSTSPKAEPPVLITSCGQSPGPTTIKVVLQRLKIPFEMDPLATPAVLQAKARTGTPYKSLIIVMGASLKGMGAAGISIDDELERAAALIAEARKEGVLIIGAHVEGLKRRAQGAAAGDTTDEQSIDAVAPNSNLLLIYKEGNSDGRFTAISQAKRIPLVEVEKMMDLIPALERLYAR